MKKYATLGKSLSKLEQKKIIGGYGDDKTCTQDSDCGSKTLTCNNVPTTANGYCRNGSCKWVAVC